MEVGYEIIPIAHDISHLGKYLPNSNISIIASAALFCWSPLFDLGF